MAWLALIPALAFAALALLVLALASALRDDEAQFPQSLNSET